MATIGNLLIELSANTARLQQDMSRAVQIQKDSANQMQAALNTVKGAMAALGVTAAALTFKEMVMGTVHAVAGLQQMSEKSGAAVEELSKISSVAKLSGTSMDEVTAALAKMSKGLVNSDEETKGASNALAALGIEARDSAGNLRDPAVVMDDVAKKLAEFKDGAGKTALVLDLFGKSGAQLLPMLKDLGVAGELQAKVSRQQAEQADELEKNLIRLGAQKQAVTKIVAMEMIPALDDFVKMLIKSSNESDGMRKSVAGLANDGTLKKWGEEAAIGVAYFVDMVMTGAKSVGVLRAEMSLLAAAGSLVAEKMRVAGANPIVQNARLKGPRAEYDAAVDEVANRGRDLWGFELASDKLKKSMAERKANEAGQEFDHGVAGRSKDLNYSPAKKAVSAGDAEERKYINALQQIEEKRIALLQLGDYEALMYKLLSGSLSDLTDKHKEELKARALVLDLQQRTIKDAQTEWEWIQKRRDAESDAVAGFNDKNARARDDANFNISLIGKTTTEVQKLTAARQIDLDRQEAYRQLGEFATEKQIADLTRTALLRKKAADEEIDAAYKLRTAWSTGMQDGINRYVEMVTDAAKQTESLLTNAFRGMEDALVSFVKTGKMDFRSLADSIVSDLIRIQVRQGVTLPLSEGIRGLDLSSLFGGGQPQQLSGPTDGGNWLTNLFRASGGPVSGGSPYIVGEQGPELFVPGVSGTIVPNDAMGGGQSVTVVQHINVDSRSDRASIMLAMAQAKDAAVQSIAGMLARNGQKSIAGAMV